ncbi:glycerol-3-phosphate acyltransferase, partial [Chloroflexota bacterium]
VISGYLLGSIPTACIAGRLLKGKAIRQIGDGTGYLQHDSVLSGRSHSFLHNQIDCDTPNLTIFASPK